MPISVGKIMHKIPVWAIDKLEHGQVLGRTHHKAARLKLKKMDNGSCRATIYTSDKIGIVRWLAVHARAKQKPDKRRSFK
jgi:hypothetical protein